MPKRLLPDDFCFGASSSAFQTEGGAQEGGRSPSIWDKFCAKPGAIHDGSNAQHAADFYNRWPDDILLMKRVGLKNYNASVSWSRVLPDGIGTLNIPGLDFYDRLVDGLLEQGIRPWLTLNHWDLPLKLEESGGWIHRDMIYHFADYAQRVAACLGDRVQKWITHNDPRSQAFLGYATGDHAPGESKARSNWLAAHHLLLSHSLAREALQAEVKVPAVEIGIALRLTPIVPASDSAADFRAAMAVDGMENRWFLDALFKGEYPEDIFPTAKSESGPTGVDWIVRGDMEKLKDSVDFLGVNFYSRKIVRTQEKKTAKQKPAVFSNKKDQTDMGWELVPDSLKELLLELSEKYKPKAIYITENGAAYSDAPDAEGRIRDSRRASYISRHLEAVREAIDHGAPVQGYFVRSFLDSFEWTEGYSKRYGMVWVDFETQERILKESAHWYKRVIDTRDHDWMPSVDYRE